MSAEPRTLVTSAPRHPGAAAMNRILCVIKGKCPNCEKGEVFKSRGNILKLRAPVMHEECPHCHHHFEKEPGYFLGAMYVSYAMTLAQGVPIYILVHHFTTSLALTASTMFAVFVLLSFINFRYSRMIWMYMFTQKGSFEPTFG